MNRKKSDGTIISFNPESKDIKRLLSIFSATQEAILNKESNGEKIFSTKNFVGEYAEILCCDKLNLTQEIPSNGSYDATDLAGRKIQIKSRQLDTDLPNSGERQMGDILASDIDKIDSVITVLFNKDFSINVAYRMPRDIYKVLAKLSKNKTKYRLTLNKKIIANLNNYTHKDKVIDIQNILEN